jgi:UDP-N-acetylglucosamine transferase subunit ALG13
MIFVTVGTQLAFDRLISTVNDWAGKNPKVDIFAQTGPTSLEIRFLRHKAFISPASADDLFKQAELIVSHAGMGSILSAQKYKKPIIIVPRKAALGEHRNDHQIATAKWLNSKPGISVAWSVEELIRLLDHRKELSCGDGISDFASPELIGRLAEYLRRL